MQLLLLVPSPEAASPSLSDQTSQGCASHLLGPPELCVKLGGPAPLP